MSFEVQIRQAAEADIAEAQLWYESRRRGLGDEFYAEISGLIDILAERPFIYQTSYRDTRRAIVRRFPYLIWYRVLSQTVTVLACTHGRQSPKKTASRYQSE